MINSTPFLHYFLHVSYYIIFDEFNPEASKVDIFGHFEPLPKIWSFSLTFSFRKELLSPDFVSFIPECRKFLEWLTNRMESRSEIQFQFLNHLEQFPFYPHFWDRLGPVPKNVNTKSDRYSCLSMIAC